MANRASNLLPLAALAVALMPTGALGAARTAYDVAGAGALGVATRSAGLMVKVAGASASDVWRAPDASGDSTLWAYEVPSTVAARDIVPRAVPSGAAVDSTALLSGRALGGQDLTVLRHAYDADAEVMLARARVLDTGLGTFLQRDPEGYADSVNLYAAMANDPVNHRDPTGRLRTDELTAFQWAQLEEALRLIRAELEREGCTGPYKRRGVSLSLALTEGFGPKIRAAPLSHPFIQSRLPDELVRGFFEDVAPNEIVVFEGLFKFPTELARTIVHELHHWAEFGRTGGVTGDDVFVPTPVEPDLLSPAKAAASNCMPIEWRR